VVGLHAANRDQRVSVGSNRVRDDVFELAQLVAAESQTRIAILALGVKFDFSAQVLREPFQLFDMGRSEGERIALDFSSMSSPLMAVIAGDGRIIDGRKSAL